MNNQKYVFCGNCNAYGVFLMMAKSAYRYAKNNFENVDIGIHVQSATEEVKIVHSSKQCKLVIHDSFCCSGCGFWQENSHPSNYKHDGVVYCHEDCWHELSCGQEDRDDFMALFILWDTHPEEMRLRQEG